MHALKRFGTAFGGYKMMENYPVPECGPDDIILEIKAAAICGADMKHWGVDNGYDDTNITPDQQQSVRGHEFAGEIVKVGENVKDWHIGQRVVSDNSAHVCGVCPACEQGDFLCCEHKVNLGLDNNTWGGGSPCGRTRFSPTNKQQLSYKINSREDNALHFANCLPDFNFTFLVIEFCSGILFSPL